MITIKYINKKKLIQIKLINKKMASDEMQKLNWWKWLATAQITGRVRVSHAFATTCARDSYRASCAPNSCAAPPSAKRGVIRASSAPPNSTATRDSCATSTLDNASVLSCLSTIRLFLLYQLVYLLVISFQSLSFFFFFFLKEAYSCIVFYVYV